MTALEKARGRLKILWQRTPHDLSWYYDVSELVGSVHDAGEQDWGDKTLQLLAEGICSPSQLYLIEKFARTYRRSELKTLKPLTWSHVESLCTVPHKRLRNQLAAKCKKEKWPVVLLQRAIQTAFGKRSNRSGHLPTELGNIARLAEELRSALDELLDPEGIMEAAPIEKLGKAAEDIESAVGELDQLQIAAASARKQLKRHHSKAAEEHKRQKVVKMAKETLKDHKRQRFWG